LTPVLSVIIAIMMAGVFLLPIAKYKDNPLHKITYTELIAIGGGFLGVLLLVGSAVSSEEINGKEKPHPTYGWGILLACIFAIFSALHY